MPTETRIRPALTPDQMPHLERLWEDDEDFEEAFAWMARKFSEMDESMPPIGRHGVAALALHNTPEGFTQQDVSAIRMVAEQHRYLARTGDTNPAAITFYDSLADRIATLLPPG